MKFRKKPVVIEAIQFTGAVSFAKMKNAWPNFGDFANFSPEMAEKMPISTLEGILGACSGDWIIKGVKGEFYPCRNDIFELTYEPAES